MKLVWGSLLSALVFLVVGGLLSTAVRLACPGDFDALGHAFGKGALFLNILVQGLSAFAAGAVAAGYAGHDWRRATAFAGGGLFVLLLLATVAFWTAAPAWFNVVTLAMTLPFVALGAAWRGSGAAHASLGGAGR